MTIQLSGRLPALQTGPGDLSFRRWGQHTPRVSPSPWPSTTIRPLPPCSPEKWDVPRWLTVLFSGLAMPSLEISGRQRSSQSSQHMQRINSQKLIESQQLDNKFHQLTSIRAPAWSSWASDLRRYNAGNNGALMLLSNPKEQISFIIHT